MSFTDHHHAAARALAEHEEARQRELHWQWFVRVAQSIAFLLIVFATSLPVFA